MPGPVSDSYDPEWGTGDNADRIRDELRAVYVVVSGVLGDRPPLYILDLVDMDLPIAHGVVLTEKQWRIIRFALERAGESI